MQHRAGSIPNLHPGSASLGGWRGEMKGGSASQGRMSALCAAAGRAGHRHGEKPGPWCCPLRVLAMSVLRLLLFASSSLS